MITLGIETSCDECAAAVVHRGRILSNVVATQIPVHARWQGVVPELASRMHTEWIYGVAEEALRRAGATPGAVEGVAATARPGLLGSLLVGLHFAKAFAWARKLPFIAVDHLLAHLYASQLSYPEDQEGGPLSPPSPADSGVSFSAPLRSVSLGRLTADPKDTALPPYPFIGLLVSGGHSVICRADAFDGVTVLGATIDDAVGEAFDKVSKFYGFGYPGGAAIDRLSRQGDSEAFAFPLPNLYKLDKQGRDHRYDLSYSGLKTAVVNQLEQFRRKARPAAGTAPAEHPEAADIAASFQKTAVEILLRPLLRAVEDTGIRTVVAGGGVAANSYLRARLAEHRELQVIFPPPELCGDNAAMVAGIGEQYLLRGDRSPFNAPASSRVRAFKKQYP